MLRGGLAGASRLPLRIYNTASRRVEEFVLYRPGEARGYVCGVTPYDSPHVGHGRVYVFFDVFRRFLEYLGVSVRLVINFTDVDDKIVERARAEFGVDLLRRWYEVPRRFIEEFFWAMRELNVKPAHAYPRVTEHVHDMVKWVADLVESGHAYVAPDGSVYFSVRSVPGYGSLSGQDPARLVAGARVEPEPGKRDPLDFALWKSYSGAEPYWDSPWGPGRPGWHLECVVMSTKYLGAPFDFHGGGVDLIFPHHENEVAIARVRLGLEYFARFWIHVGYVTVRGEKMSKSLGNVVTIREVVDRFGGEALRLVYLATSYSKPMEFDWGAVESALEDLRTVYAAYDVLSAVASEVGEGSGDLAGEVLGRGAEYVSRFESALLDDMSTGAALGAFMDFARFILGRVVPVADRVGRDALLKLLDMYVSLGDVLGLLARREVPPRLVEAVKALLEVRARARRERSYEFADAIRSALNVLGVQVFDYGARSYFSVDRYALRGA